jgi:hypothetical protein
LRGSTMNDYYPQIFSECLGKCLGEKARVIRHSVAAILNDESVTHIPRP